MKTSTIPSLRVDPELRAAAESVLEGGETLSSFVEHSLRVKIERRYTKAARDDLRRLYGHLLQHDGQTARRTRSKIAEGVELLKEFPFTCRKASSDALPARTAHFVWQRRYVFLFEIEDATTVTILAVRHQRADDYL